VPLLFYKFLMLLLQCFKLTLLVSRGVLISRATKLPKCVLQTIPSPPQLKESTLVATKKSMIKLRTWEPLQHRDIIAPNPFQFIRINV
jgi:hypothetical protein